MRDLGCGVVLALVATAAGAETYGKPLQGLAPTALADVLARPEAGAVVRLDGTVERVCRQKGCWLELKQGEGSIHVTFADYAFFVPRDSAGKQVAIEGRVRVQAPRDDEVEHKAAEGASVAGGRVSIEATGVEIRDPER